MKILVLYVFVQGFYALLIFGVVLFAGILGAVTADELTKLTDGSYELSQDFVSKVTSLRHAIIVLTVSPLQKSYF